MAGGRHPGDRPGDRSGDRRRPVLRIGIDSGGTFTDVFVLSPRGRLAFKVPSTPRDPARAVVRGARRAIALAARPPAPDRAAAGGPARPRWSGAVEIVHGTTVGTNALLTRSGARTALVTTAGFEDLIEIGRQNRESLYDLAAVRPPSLAPRALRFGVRERIFLADPGDRPGAAADPPRAGVRRPPSSAEIARLAARLRAAGAESVAVGFLHSYLDPAHEQRVARALAARGFAVTASHTISGEHREFERFQTAVANAYLRPVAGRYLARLGETLRPARLMVLQSDGTTATASAAAREPVRTVLSGPAGGVLAVLDLSQRLGDRRALAFDMGGTSTDASLIDGRLPRTSQARVAGVAIRSPMIDVTSVGAGGGSIARRDSAGALRVGPESAGADPGPACYGRGTRPTVTDAHLVLGRLGAHDLLGGDFPVDPRRARAAVQALARSLGLGLEEAAEGILAVVEATMERALRAVSIARGEDPRRFTLYAFGGAGGLHACGLADRLGIRRIVVPPDPGAFSAVGLAAAAPGVETAATVLARPEDRRRLASALRRLEAEARARLSEQRLDARAARLERFADLRYAGQSHEITVPYGPAMTRTFAAAHRARYGHARPGAPVEVVTVRVRAKLRAPAASSQAQRKPRGNRRAAGDPVRGGGAARPARSRATIVIRGRRARCLIVPRASLGARERIAGPARITEYSGTTFVPPGWQASSGPEGTLVLTPLGRARGRRAQMTRRVTPRVWAEDPVRSGSRRAARPGPRRLRLEPPGPGGRS